MKTAPDSLQRSRSKATIRPLAWSIASLIALTVGAQAASQTWDGGSVVDGNWSTVDNWNGAVPGSTSSTSNGDTATFSAAILNTWGDSALNPVVIDSATQNIKSLTFSGSAAGNYFIGNTAGNALLLTNGGIIQIASGVKAGAVETVNAPLEIQGTGSSSYTIQNASANGASGGTLVIGGAITSSSEAGSTTTLLIRSANTNGNTIDGFIGNGSAGGELALTKMDAGSWTLTGANIYTGATDVRNGALTLSGLGSISGSSAVTVGFAANTTVAKLTLDNDAAVADRIGDTASVNVSLGAELALIGNTTTATTETIGALSIGTGSDSSSAIITLSGTGAGILTTLDAASFARVNHSTALIRGTSLGQQATNATRLTLTSLSGLSFVGTTTANASSPGTAKDVKIVPYLLGATSASSNGSGFMTYDTTGGLRVLGTNESVTLSSGYTSAVNPENVKAFNGTIGASDPIVNSLLFNVTSQTLHGSGVLSVKSGAVAAVSSGTTIGSSFSSLLLGDGTWNEGVLTAASGVTFTIDTSIDVTGDGGITKAGRGNLILNRASGYLGTTYVNEGILTIGHSQALGSTVGETIVNGQSGASLNLVGNINTAENITIIGQRPTNGQSLTNSAGNNTISGLLTLPAEIRIGSNVAGASLTFAGGVSGTNTFFILNGSGRTIFKDNPVNIGSGGQYYADSGGEMTIIAVAGNTWGTTVIASILRTDVANALPTGSALQIGGIGYSPNALYEMNGNDQSIGSLESKDTAAGTVQITSGAAATLTVNHGSTKTYRGGLTGAVSLVKNGSGLLTLTGQYGPTTSRHTGDTVVNGGTLAIGNATLLQNSTLDTGTAGAQQVTFTAAGTNTYLLGGLRGGDDLSIGANSLNVGNNHQSTTFTGAILGTTGGLTKVGQGALTLGGANTFTGATAVDHGTLILDFTSSDTGKLAAGADLTLGSATLQLDRSTAASGTYGEIVGATTINGGASITRGAGSTVTIRLNTITRNPGGLLDLGEAGIATTDTNNTNGILGAWATINSSDWAMSVDSGAADTAIMAFTGYTDIAALGGTIADGAASNVRINTMGSAGNVQLGATTTTVNTLLQATGTASIVETFGKTLQTSGIMIASGQEALTIGSGVDGGNLSAATAGGELILLNYSDNALTINSILANNSTASSLTIGGTGTTVLAGTNTFTGKTSVQGGTLSIAAETALGVAPGVGTADQLTLNDGTLLSTASFSIDDPNRGLTLGAAGGTLETAAAQVLTIANTVAGTGDLAKTGDGALILSGTNTFTGGTTISAGVLSVDTIGDIGESGNLGQATTGLYGLVFDGGLLSYTGVTDSTNRTFAITDGQTGTIEVVNSGTTLTMSGGAGDSTGALTKTGDGQLNLSGINGYGGLTTVSAGILEVQHSSALGTTAAGTIVEDGAALQLSGNVLLAEDLSLAGEGVGFGGALRNVGNNNVVTGVITAGSSATRIMNISGSLTLAGGIQRPGGITTDRVLLGGGITVMDEAIDIGDALMETIGASGTTVLAVAGNQYGTLQVSWNSTTRTDVAGALDPTAVLELGSNSSTTGSAPTGTLDLNGYHQTVGGLRTGAANLGGSGTRIVTSSAPATLTVDQSGDSEYDGQFTGALALTKDGGGTLALSGASTNTGATIVSSGTLVVAGSLGGTSSVEVASAAKLATDAAGSIATSTGGDVSVSGVLAPGNTDGAGTLSLTLGTGGHLDFSGGSTLAFGLGTTSDLVTFDTAGDWLGGSGNATLVLDVTLVGFDYGNTYTVFQNVSTVGFAFADIVGYDTGGYVANFVQVGNDYEVSFAAVPEPGSLASLIGGLSLLLGLRRHRPRRRTV